MDCKKVRDIISTDYIDMQLKIRVQRQVEGHIKSCGSCGQFEALVRKAAVEPFAGSAEVRPPDEVWQGIKEKIMRQPESRGFLARALESLQLALVLSRPGLAFGTGVALFAAVLIAINLYMGPRRGINNYFQEQAEFLSGLDNETPESVIQDEYL